MENRDAFIHCVRQLRMSELRSNERIKAIQAGLSSIVPLQLLHLLTPHDVCIRMCGLPYVNLDFLKVMFYGTSVHKHTPQYIQDTHANLKYWFYLCTYINLYLFL